MKVNTAANKPIDSALLSNYFDSLVNRFFKILPIREQDDGSLVIYLKGFRDELLGCNELVDELKQNALFMTLLSTLQYLIDNPDAPVKKVRRYVFGAISVCNKLRSLYEQPDSKTEG